MRAQSDQMTRRRLGITAALAAFLAWGFMPGFFKWIDHIDPVEILAHRVIWALPVLALFLLVRDGRKLFPKLRLKRREVGWLAIAALMLSANWLIFVWAVVNDRVLSTSLGYFINPLVNIVLGYLFLQERLTRYQQVAVGIAAAGTAYMGWYLGATPWISLSLALLFGGYGLVRKRLSVGPMTGLMWENLMLVGPAIAYLAWRNSQGTMDFMHLGLDTDLLLVAAGLVTVLPLIWFNTAAQALTLSVVGFFQYLAPTISMLLAVFLWNEPFTLGHAVAFACIWLGLALISGEQVRAVRHRRRV
ncbi:MAG: EamA family transporter RarD [Xanthomonadales bacterium]|nr:EamA family transporter RarD [Xanthomonadales bacterium]